MLSLLLLKLDDDDDDDDDDDNDDDDYGNGGGNGGNDDDHDDDVSKFVTCLASLLVTLGTHRIRPSTWEIKFYNTDIYRSPTHNLNVDSANF